MPPQGREREPCLLLSSCASRRERNAGIDVYGRGGGVEEERCGGGEKKERERGEKRRVLVASCVLAAAATKKGGPFFRPTYCGGSLVCLVSSAYLVLILFRLVEDRGRGRKRVEQESAEGERLRGISLSGEQLHWRPESECVRLLSSAPLPRFWSVTMR